MTNQHSIIPPLELVQQWVDEYIKDKPVCVASEFIAIRAAQWGADQELEACCDHIHTFHGKHRADWLRDMRRSKPPSLKEQALAVFKEKPAYFKELIAFDTDQVNIIRRALEQLND